MENTDKLSKTRKIYLFRKISPKFFAFHFMEFSTWYLDSSYENEPKKVVSSSITYNVLPTQIQAAYTLTLALWKMAKPTSFFAEYLETSFWRQKNRLSTRNKVIAFDFLKRVLVKNTSLYYMNILKSFKGFLNKKRIFHSNLVKIHSYRLKTIANYMAMVSGSLRGFQRISGKLSQLKTQITIKGRVALKPILGPKNYTTRHTYSESASNSECRGYLRTFKFEKKIFSYTPPEGSGTKNFFFRICLF